MAGKEVAEYFALDTRAPCLDLYLSETQVSPHSLALCTRSCPLSPSAAYSVSRAGSPHSVRGRFAAGISSSLAAATGVVSPSSTAGFASVSVAASVFAVASPSSAGGVEDAEASKALAASAFASSSSSAAAAASPLDESTSPSSFLVLVVSSALAAGLEASGAAAWAAISLGASSAFDCPSAAPGLVVAAAAASVPLLQSSESSSSLS